MSAQKQVVSADEIAAAAFPFRHPLDATVGCMIAPVSRMSGLKNAAINLVRIAPGERAFPLHRHHGEEEWVYIIDGAGDVVLDDHTHPVGPGDFAVFPAAGAAHAVRNTGTVEMVCLMGGDGRAVDVVDFPELGKRVVHTADGYEAAPAGVFETIMPKPATRGDA